MPSPNYSTNAGRPDAAADGLEELSGASETEIAVAGQAPSLRNYYDSSATAARYAEHRPREHPNILKLIEEGIGSGLPVDRALDVGCGTGHSTMALLRYARSAVGLDASAFMLAQASAHPDIRYVRGHAESLPFRRDEFDLLTVGSAYHWFDQDRFIGEAHRVLRADGWLVLYKVGSTGRIVNSPTFATWVKEVFRPRFPKVARNEADLSPERAGLLGFTEVLRTGAGRHRTYTLTEYVENLLTHSSLLRVIGVQEQSVAAIRDWLSRELEPFFPGGQAEFTHDDWIHLLRRNSVAIPVSPR